MCIAPYIAWKIIESIDLILRHTLDRMYLTSILEVQYLQIGQHNDDNEEVWYANKQMPPSDHKVLNYLHTMLNQNWTSLSAQLLRCQMRSGPCNDCYVIELIKKWISYEPCHEAENRCGAIFIVGVWFSELWSIVSRFHVLWNIILTK